MSGPIISWLNSFKESVELQAGLVFGLGLPDPGQPGAFSLGDAADRALRGPSSSSQPKSRCRSGSASPRTRERSAPLGHDERLSMLKYMPMVDAVDGCRHVPLN